MLPDVNHFIPNEHRVLLHNLFIIPPVVSIALYARFKLKNIVLYNIALIASFFLLSHVMLDFFTDAEVPLFYPLATTNYASPSRSSSLKAPSCSFPSDQFCSCRAKRWASCLRFLCCL
jgi:membrane-bound metal-dependent hydrolase YbcI (DUF457 family)